MRPNVVLIDYESVQPDSLEALNQDFFFVMVFVGSNQKKLPIEMVKALQKFGQRADYIEISGSGPNALDFHIAYYIGKISANDPSTFFHIISKDTGFDPLITHLKNQKISIQRITKISEISLCSGAVAKAPKTPPVVDSVMAHILELLRKNATNRPKKKKTLLAHLKSHLGKNGTDAAALKLFDKLHKAKRIGIDDKEAVSYHL